MNDLNIPAPTSVFIFAFHLIKYIMKKLLFVAAALCLLLSSCDRIWDPDPGTENNGSGNTAPEEKPGPTPPPTPPVDTTDTPEPPEPVDPYADFTKIDETLMVGPVSIVEEPGDGFMRGYWPDGKLIPVRRGEEWQLFWCEAYDVLTVASTPWPEDHVSQLKESNKVFGKGFSSIKDFNENGSWFIGIFPQGNDGHYVGFFHAESHWAGDGTAHKSIGVAYSDDYGYTWHDAAPIIVENRLKPETPTWSGLGDGCVIWDSINSRYICYYQGKISSGANTLCMAVSYDKEGASGTWKKWDGNDFTLYAYDAQTGIGGENIAIKPLNMAAGANPSVMWNTYLEKWVMVYASWGHYVYVSYSDDGITWSIPKKVIGKGTEPAWYPNMISEDGDLVGGKTVKLYYSHNQGSNGKRNIGCRTLIFNKPE